MPAYEYDQIDQAHRNADAVFEVHRIKAVPGRHPGEAWIDTLIASLGLGDAHSRRDIDRARQQADYWAVDGGVLEEPDRQVWVQRFAEDLGLQVLPGLPSGLVDAVGWALCVHEHGEDEADVLWQDDQRSVYLEKARVALRAAESHQRSGEGQLGEPLPRDRVLQAVVKANAAFDRARNLYATSRPGFDSERPAQAWVETVIAELGLKHPSDQVDHAFTEVSAVAEAWSERGLAYDEQPVVLQAMTEALVTELDLVVSPE